MRMRLLRKLFNGISLKKKIFVLLVPCMAGMLLIMLLLAGVYSNNMLVEKMIDNSYQNLNVISEKLDLLTQNIESYSVLVLTNKDVQKWLEGQKNANYSVKQDVFAYLLNIIKSNCISNLIIHTYHDTGEAFSVNKFIDPDRKIEDTDFVRQFYGMQESYLWKLNENYYFTSMPLSAGKCVMSYYRKIYNENTVEVVGCVELMVDESVITELYENIRLAGTGHYVILDHSGKVVSYKDKGELGKDYSDKEYYNAISQSEGNHKITMGNQEYLVTNKMYKKLGWNIVGIVPVAEVVKDSRRLQLFLLFLGGFFIVLTVFMGTFLAKYVSDPIIRLKKIIIQIGEGRRDIKISQDRSDEIGELFFAFSRMIEKNDDLMKNLLEEQNRKKEYELALIQSQLNPHFLYNTLECICGMASLNKTDDIIFVVKELAFFYRGVLSKGNKVIPVKTELNIIERYFNILKYRYPNKLNYEIDCQKEAENCSILKLCLQPIVENAVLHGLRGKKNDWNIKVQVYIENERVILCVYDSGIGMDSEKIKDVFNQDEWDKEKVNFGIKATDERIKLCYGMDYGIHIESELGKFTKVYFVFPYNTIDHAPECV